MVKRYLILALTLISFQAYGATAEEETYQALSSYFQELLGQDAGMAQTIKNNFGVDSPEMIEFLMQQIDPIGLAVELFKQQFTLEEIQAIVTFHTSASGRKFAAIYPYVIAEYSEALNKRMADVKLAVAGAVAEQFSKKD